MGLFRKSKVQGPVSHNPFRTYHIEQNLSGRLNVTSKDPNAYSYSITLAMKKGWRDTIEITIHRSANSTHQDQGDIIGYCLVHTRQGKFVKCRFDAYGEDIKLDRAGSNNNLAKSNYHVTVPGLGKFKWTHDQDSVTGANKQLKLIEENTDAVLARFRGSHQGISEFGVIEVYDLRVANDQAWCGLCLLTAVCVFAREERSRERKGKISGAVEKATFWGGLLTLGIPAP